MSILLTALLLAAPEPAAQPPAPPAPAEKMICKRQQELGSRISRGRDCRTRAEWDRLARATNDDLRRSRDFNQPGN